MSVTFSAVQPIIAYRIECACSLAETGMFVDYEEAQAELLAGNVPVCGDEDCVGRNGWVTPVHPEDDPPYVNMANANARDVLNALGQRDGDMSGSMTGAEMLAAVTIALSEVPADTGRRTVADGIVINLGRPALYIQSKLDDIRTVAFYASERGYEVSWG